MQWQTDKSSTENDVDLLNDGEAGGAGVQIERCLQVQNQNRKVVAAAAGAPEQTRVDKVKAEMQMFFAKTATATRPALEAAAAGGTRMADGAQGLCTKTAAESMKVAGAVQGSLGHG